MSNRSRALATAAALAIAVAGLATTAQAQSLQDAIALAYRTNPTLLAQRANQRALDETYVQARSGLRPTLSVSGGAGYSYRDLPDTPPTPGFDFDGDGIEDFPGDPGSDNISDGTSASVGVSLNQNLYTGGRIAHGINAAEASVLAGRENLRDVEQEVMQSVIQAYVDVLRDEEVLVIRRDNIAVLQRQLEESNARFEVGEITRTDVAQSEARLAQSESDLAVAEAQLSVSRAAFAAVVGQAPATLEATPALPPAPTDFDVALDSGLVRNPALAAAEYNLRAAEAQVAQTRAEYRPSVGLSASLGNSFDSLSNLDLNDSSREFSATANISVPLFTGGLNASRVAQALERANAAQIGVEGQRRNVLQLVSSAYAQVIAARSTLQAGEEAVRAATIAAEGVRQEAQVGLRTTLDVLNQELELRAAQVTLANARRNEYVAQAALLAAMGQLSGASLAPVEAYDPADNFQRVRNRGAVPWEFLVESLDRIAAPAIVPANDQEDAPVDAQLKSEVIQTAPGT
ncbi:TolC family outer membrane protein [Brevundimonas sp.]|uniref:TolC family outer membrane protein n=1 Tax=Brevundimonas sp. TaxID=1871086 RepID=UPI0035B07C80